MKTLIIRLTAPLQSYGNEATFNRRTSYHYPSKSAVLGMVAAALGYRRDDSRIVDLNKLLMAVRIDQNGQTLTDFQIIEYDQKSQKRSLSYRDYLQDAVFLVALAGNDDQIDLIQEALHHPKFQLFLGRRSNAPAGVFQTKVIKDQSPVDVLKTYDWQASEWYQKRWKRENYSAEIIADANLLSDTRSELVRDNIGSFSQIHRYHSYRAVSTVHTELKNPFYEGTSHDIMANL